MKDFDSDFDPLITGLDVTETSLQYQRTESFDEVSIRTLRNIYAPGKERELTKMGQSARACTTACLS